MIHTSDWSAPAGYRKLSLPAPLYGWPSHEPNRTGSTRSRNARKDLQTSERKQESVFILQIIS